MLDDHRAVPRPRLGKPLEPRDWGRTPVEGREQVTNLLHLRLNHGVNKLVACLEVVVDVARRHVCRVGDLSQRGALDALAVQQIGCARYETFSLAGTRWGLG